MQGAETTRTQDEQRRSISELLSIAGESRINLVRLSGILFFYLQHCISFYVMTRPEWMTDRYHALVTWIVVSWMIAAALLFHGLRQSRLPARASEAIIIFDLIMAYMLIAVSGGVASSLIHILPVIVFSSALRDTPARVWFALAGSVACYLVLLGRARWFSPRLPSGLPDSAGSVPRTEQLIVVATLIVCGMLAGQVVRQRRWLLEFGGQHVET